MADDLKYFLDHSGDEGPPEDYVRALRATVIEEAERIDREADANASNVHEITLDLHTGRDIDPDRPSPRHQRWTVVAAAVGALVILGAVFALRAESPPPVETINAPAINDTVTVTNATFNPTATRIESRSRNEVDSGERTVLEPGSYRTDALGTPLSIDVRRVMGAETNDAGLLVLHDSVTTTQDRTITIARLSALSDPTRPRLRFEDLDSPWPANDIEGWIDALDNPLSTTRVEQTTLGGNRAVRFELWAPSSECAAGRACALFATNKGLDTQFVEAGHGYEIWVVTQGAQDPIAIIVDDPRFDDSEWRSRARELVSSIGFGPTEPNPVIRAGDDRESLDLLGGISFDGSDDTAALRNGPGLATIGLDGWFAETRFLTNPVRLNGDAVDTADQLASAIAANAVAVTESEPTTIDGFAARVFDVEGSGEPALLATDAMGATWDVPSRARLWVIGHPERGVLIISAEARANVAITWPLIEERTEELISSLEFVEITQDR